MSTHISDERLIEMSKQSRSYRRNELIHLERCESCSKLLRTLIRHHRNMDAAVASDIPFPLKGGSAACGDEQSDSVD